MNNVEHYIIKQSRPFYCALGFVLIAILGLFDHLTGTFSFTIVYFLPIALVTWYAGARYGLFILFLSFLAAIVADVGDEAFAETHLLWHLLVELSPLVVLQLLLAIYKKVKDEHEILKRVDHLTGAINARYFSELAEKEINRAKRTCNPFTVAYIELKNLTRGQDIFGELIDKDKLTTFAQSLQSTVRTTDIVARIKAEGFALLFPDTCSSSATVVLEKVRECAQELANDSEDLVIVRMGSVTFHSPPETVEDMLLKTNSLIHSVKTSRKNVVKQSMPSA
jgi:diguanylate cyclase (GGDEF)-like protein